MKTIALELTQCLSLVGVGKPSFVFFVVFREKRDKVSLDLFSFLSLSLISTLSKKKKKNSLSLPYPLEDVPLVPVAVGAPDLRAHHPARGVLDPHQRPGHLGVEGGPAAARVELGLCLVQLGAAAGAVEGALFRVELVVLSRAGGLGARLAQDVELLFVCVGGGGGVVSGYMAEVVEKGKDEEEEKKMPRRRKKKKTR